MEQHEPSERLGGCGSGNTVGSRRGGSLSMKHGFAVGNRAAGAFRLRVQR